MPLTAPLPDRGCGSPVPDDHAPVLPPPAVATLNVIGKSAAPALPAASRQRTLTVGFAPLVSPVNGVLCAVPPVVANVLVIAANAVLGVVA